MFNIINNNWDFITDKRLEELEKIYEAVKENGYFPKAEHVLRFLEMDIHNLKYIIMGMEPYPTDIISSEGIKIPEATGRSFEVSSLKGKDWNTKFKQSSLRNILKTVYYNKTGEKASLEKVREEIGKTFFISEPCKWFDEMEKQGVLFLNASLTVQPYKVGSHAKLWENFMTELIEHINKNTDAKWLLWGNNAKERVGNIIPEEKCIITCHPRLAQFVDANCFQYADKVNWEV